MEKNPFARRAPYLDLMVMNSLFLYAVVWLLYIQAFFDPYYSGRTSEVVFLASGIVWTPFCIIMMTQGYAFMIAVVVLKLLAFMGLVSSFNLLHSQIKALGIKQSIRKGIMDCQRSFLFGIACCLKICYII